MKKIILAALALVLLVAGVTAAQDAQAQVTTTRQTESSGEQTSTRVTQKTDTSRSPRTRANIKVDVIISDQTGSAAAEKKVVSLIAAEESWGKIRTQAHARMSDGGFLPVSLNVDARPFLTGTGAVQLELTVEYNPLGSAKDTTQMRPTALNQSLTVVLQSGKPLLVSQAADPILDRKIVVEVVAAILK